MTPSGASATVDFDDGALTTISENAERSVLWPSWRPGHAQLLWSQVDDGTSLRLAGEEVPGASTRPELFLGPGLPHYALWSPRGKRLAYVVPDSRSLVLKVWTPGESEAKALVAGAPIFPAWHPSEDVLVVHHGTALEEFDLVSGVKTVLSRSAAGFRTPAVSPDGEAVAWAEVRDGAVRVMKRSHPGSGPSELRSFEAGLVLQFVTPQRLIAAVGSSPESLAFASLRDVDTGETVVRSVMTAAWFSPDGTRCVTLHPAFSGDGRYQARLWDGAGRALSATELFVPSAQVGTVVNFFDQYQLSHPLWSADSRWFGLCGRFATEGPHPAFSDGIQDYVWLWDAETGTVHRRVAPGSFLSFER